MECGRKWKGKVTREVEQCFEMVVPRGWCGDACRSTLQATGGEGIGGGGEGRRSLRERCKGG